MGEDLSIDQKQAEWKAPRTGDPEIEQDTALEQKQAVDLKNLPIIDSAKMREALPTGKEPTRFVQVQTDKIVGRPLEQPAQKGGWGYEYGARQGRISSVAQSLKTGDPQAQERVFHLNDPKQRIQLSALRGPAGPIYAVEDGTHRVAGAKLAQMETIPAEVRDKTYPRVELIRTGLDARELEQKIKAGMVEGSIIKVKTTTGEDAYQATIRSEVVPWASVSSQNDMVNISRIYEKLYPHSLDNLSVPRDVLVDPIANNFYMSGKWGEWKSQFENKPRDERGIVIY